jgi:ABC-type antimicrobial peptide transport system permease subunit
MSVRKISEDKEKKRIQTLYLTKGEVLKMIGITDKYESIVQGVETDNPMGEFLYSKHITQAVSSDIIEQLDYNNKVTYRLLSFKFPYNKDYKLTSGRIWSESDVEKNYVWVTQSFVQEQAKGGNFIKAEDEIWFHTVFYSYNEDTKLSNLQYYSEKFIIKGIMDLGSNGEEFNGQSLDFFFDLRYGIATFDVKQLGSSNLKITFSPPKTRYKFDEVYELNENLMLDIKNSFKNLGENVRIEVESTLIEEFKLTRLLSAGVVLVSIFLGILIMFLSIGSVANTIIISVDKNKKFIGLLKAMGLKQRDVESLVKIEVAITISIGIVLSTIFMSFLLSSFDDLIEQLIYGLFYQLAYMDFVVKTVVPLYLPISIIFVFLGTSLLFSKSSLHNISKMDVITIISEVS